MCNDATAAKSRTPEGRGRRDRHGLLPCLSGGMRSSQLPADEPRTPPQQRPLLTIDEAATYLNVPARWVADAVRQRRVRCTRIGKHIRFRVEHLDELVATGEQPVTSDVIPIQRNRARSKL